MSENVPPVVTSASEIDREIGVFAALESEAGLPSAGTGAGDLTPMEAAILDLSKDLSNLLHLAGQLKKQGEALESFARLLKTDMERIQSALRATKTYEIMTSAEK